MRQSHLILTNAAFMWAARILLLVPQLILIPFLIRTIGDTGYGVYALVWSLMMSIEQLQMSLQSGVVKYSAGFLAQGRIDSVNRIISSSFVYSILLAILVCVGIFLAAALYNDPTGKITSSLVVLGLIVLLLIPLTPYIAVIQSQQRYYVSAIAETGSKYISLFIIVTWFNMIGPSVEAVVAITAVMMFLSRLAQVPVAYHLVPGLRNHPRSFEWKSFRLITSFGAAIVLASLCVAANSTGVRWLMDTLVSTSFVAHLAIMLMPGMLLSQIIDAVTITVMPATSAYEALGNKRILQDLLIQGMRYTTILVMAGLLVSILLMRNVLAAWVGTEYEFLTPYALTLFASVSFMLSTSIGHHMLKGMGKLRTVVFIYWIGLVIVPFSFILMVFQLWHDPYIAVTFGLAIGHLICGCFQIGYSARAVKADLRELITRVYVQPLFVSVVVYIIILTIVTHSGLDNLLGRAVLSGLAILMIFCGCYFFIASSMERQQILKVVHVAKSKIMQNRKTSGES